MMRFSRPLTVILLGVRSTEVSEQSVQFTLNNEKTVSVFEKINRIIHNEGTLRSPTNGADINTYTRKLFPGGRGLFSSLQIGHCYEHCREFENAFAVIPLPKWDEAQSEYWTIADAGANITAVLVTAQNDEMTGAMIEALNSESWRTVTPAYVDVSLGTKSAREPHALEMINLVLDSRYIDFAYLYDGWTGWTFRMESFLKEGEFASAYASSETAVKTYYEKVLETFFKE